MIYAFILKDRPDPGDLRQSIRPAHRAYVAQVAERIAFAGALVADDGVTRIGSLLAIDFPDRTAAENWLSHEPYTQAGLYASIQIDAFLNLWPQKTGFPPA